MQHLTFWFPFCLIFNWWQWTDRWTSGGNTDSIIHKKKWDRQKHIHTHIHLITLNESTYEKNRYNKYENILILLIYVPWRMSNLCSTWYTREWGWMWSINVQDEIIDTYEIPNVENAVSLCQQVCQIQEGCSYFTYDNTKELCSLFQYRLLSYIHDVL